MTTCGTFLQISHIVKKLEKFQNKFESHQKMNHIWRNDIWIGIEKQIQFHNEPPVLAVDGHNLRFEELGEVFIVL